MNSEIITALISGICVAVPSILATIFSNYQNIKKNEESKKLTIYRLEKLEEKVDKQNNIIEKIYRVEKEVEVIKDDIKELKEDMKI